MCRYPQERWIASIFENSQQDNCLHVSFYKLSVQKCSLSLRLVKGTQWWNERSQKSSGSEITFFTLEQNCWCRLTPICTVQPTTGVRQALSFIVCFGTGRWDQTVCFTCHKQVTRNSSEQCLRAKICFLTVSLVTDLSLSYQREDGMMGKSGSMSGAFLKQHSTLDSWKSTDRCGQIVSFACKRPRS